MGGDSNNVPVAEKEYVSLKDLKVELYDSIDSMEKGAFILCFWLYLGKSPTSFPAIILHQDHPEINSSVPFLLLTEDKRLMLFPVHVLHQETPRPENPVSWTELPSAFTHIELPANKWVHVGCEVSPDFIRLYIDGESVGEKSLTPSCHYVSHSDGSTMGALPVIRGNDGGLQEYVHNVEVLPLTSDIKVHYPKDPPLQLHIDYSSTSEIEEDNDGVWSIVGGKASCRRIFSLEVALVNAFGHLVNKEMEVLASLVYADNEVPVEKSIDAEAPLLASYDGVEFPSSDRPSKLINGRASFKLKISQLSSKCDNRLFRIRFDIPRMAAFSFLGAMSRPIRCISRNRISRASTIIWKKSPPGFDNGALEAVPNVLRDARPSPCSKRVKIGHEESSQMLKDNLISKRTDEDCNSHTLPASEDNHVNGTCLNGRVQNHETRETSSDSENSEATNSVLKSMPNNKTPISDVVVFRYCLGDLRERSLLLKEIAKLGHEDELAKFADQVSLLSGCFHHRHQIIIAKRLIEEGMKTWNLVSQNSQQVPWENMVAGIKEHFLTIAVRGSRSLTHQDFNLLRKIAGCQDSVTQENFEKLWCWLYPVALTLSQHCINGAWESVTPRWIEGFITKEEAESSLQGPGGLQDPGTFILRFPTSRSWPHPDAGNLVVTYVGSDYMIHHRLLSRDLIFSSHAKPLRELLLEVPELSHLGRVVRTP